MATKEKTVIGANVLIDIVGVVNDVPAKVDTGADSSAVWASGIFVDKQGLLHYVLFDKKSPLYTGVEYTTREFSVAGVVSSSGHRQIRYRVKLSARINGRRVVVGFNLSNRSKHHFPVLIGKRTLKGKFLVDVSESSFKVAPRKTPRLNKEMQENPYEFFRKYHQPKPNEVKE